MVWEIVDWIHLAQYITVNMGINVRAAQKEGNFLLAE